MIEQLACIPLMLLLGCRDKQPVALPSQETSAVHSTDKDVAKITDKDVAKIIVTREGVIYLDGQQVTLDKLDGEIARRLPEVWYHREHPEDENPHETAMKVLGIIVKHRRPVALYLDRDFTIRAKPQMPKRIHQVAVHEGEIKMDSPRLIPYSQVPEDIDRGMMLDAKMHEMAMPQGYRESIQGTPLAHRNATEVQKLHPAASTNPMPNDDQLLQNREIVLRGVIDDERVYGDNYFSCLATIRIPG